VNGASVFAFGASQSLEHGSVVLVFIHDGTPPDCYHEDAVYQQRL
jgi:hypothetical protein